MAGQGFLTRAAGRTLQLFGLQASAGAGDAGKIPALDSSGRLDSSMMPVGVGAATTTATASEALTAGNFVNLYDNAGTFSARKADNSNGRVAHGFVLAAVSSSATATVYPLDSPNTGVSGLTAGENYWLGTAGGTISTPLDPVADTGKVDQYLGIAKSATELLTNDDSYVLL